MADVILSQSGIYAITNKSNGKKYVGSAVHFLKRWGKHRSELRRGIHHSQKLQRSWSVHGADNFEFSVLEIVDDKTRLLDREQFWIDAYGAYIYGYNSRPKASNMLGHKHTKETIEKCRAAKSGVKFSDEHKAKLSAWQIGSKQSEETKAKRSAALKGRPRAPDVVAKMGRKNSPETIAKRVAKLVGLKRTPEQVERNRIAQTGKKLSEETIAKRTASWKKNRSAKLAQASQ